MRDFLSERLTGYAPRQLALDYPEAGVLVPVTDNAAHPEMVFTLRSSNLKMHRGQVAYPGGKRDPGRPGRWWRRRCGKPTRKLDCHLSKWMWLPP